MRTSGILTVVATLLLCPFLRAEPLRSVASPDVPKQAPKAAQPSSDKTNSDKPSCSITGMATPDLDLELADGAGRSVARFGGVPVPLTLTDLPERVDGKVRVTTGGNGRLRVIGFVPLRSIPIYLKQDIPFIKGHVTLLKGTAVEYDGHAGDQVRIRVKTTHSIAETYNTTVACDALTVEKQKPSQWAPPGGARGYVMKQPVVSLFNKPGTDVQTVTTVHLASDARSILFYGDRREGNFIHVVYRRDVGIDGWMGVKDLEILPRGEVMDQSVSKVAPQVDKRLKMKIDGQLYKATGDLLLYGKADPKLPPIGSITKDTELYVFDVVVGWASVLPKQLDVVPLSEKHFWVRANEIGM